MPTKTISSEGLEPESGFTADSPTLAQAAQDLRTAAGHKAREFVQTAEVKASAFKERAVESAHHLRESAAEKAEQFKRTATEQWQDTRIKAKELQVTAEDYIRENPIQCVLGALGAGFLIGLIVRR
ncbi:MAG: DUF883 family protein [Verrucomicrobia bacterium]|nr:DUF883 family protein [Verrucomicrobiota bacterium]